MKVVGTNVYFPWLLWFLVFLLFGAATLLKQDIALSLRLWAFALSAGVGVAGMLWKKLQKPPMLEVVAGELRFFDDNRLWRKKASVSVRLSDVRSLDVRICTEKDRKLRDGRSVLGYGSYATALEAQTETGSALVPLRFLDTDDVGEFFVGLAALLPAEAIGENLAELVDAKNSGRDADLAFDSGGNIWWYSVRTSGPPLFKFPRLVQRISLEALLWVFRMLLVVLVLLSLGALLPSFLGGEVTTGSVSLERGTSSNKAFTAVTFSVDGEIYAIEREYPERCARPGPALPRRGGAPLLPKCDFVILDSAVNVIYEPDDPENAAVVKSHVDAVVGRLLPPLFSAFSILVLGAETATFFRLRSLLVRGKSLPVKI